MVNFCILTFDRGDRKPFYDFCKEQVKRFHFNARHICIDHRPETEECDIVPRFRKGLAIAKSEGFEWVVVVESDDYYPPDYLDRLIPYMETNDFIGDERTIYYHLGNRSWVELNHPKRSSLFTTSFRISALDGFRWPKDTTPFLDIEIWRHSFRKRCKFLNSGAIGIKHGVGKTGGSGHKRTFKNLDPELKWLEANTDSDAFGFYKSLNL